MSTTSPSFDLAKSMTLLSFHKAVSTTVLNLISKSIFSYLTFDDANVVKETDQILVNVLTTLYKIVVDRAEYKTSLSFILVV